MLDYENNYELLNSNY